MRIQLIGAHEDSRRIADGLASPSFEVVQKTPLQASVENTSRLINYDANIILFNSCDPLCNLIAAYLTGVGKELIMVARERERIPPLLANHQVLPLESKELIHLLRGLLQQSAPAEEFPARLRQDPAELLRWISEEPHRLNHLPSDLLEMLVRLLLAGLSMKNYALPGQPHSDDFIVHYRKASAAYLRCAFGSDLLSFETVLDTAEAAQNAGSDFALLITNGRITSAARQHTLHCYPSVRILDQDTLTDAIRTRIHQRDDGKRLLTSWLDKRSFVSRRDSHASLDFDGDLPTHNDNAFVFRLAGEPAPSELLISSLEKEGIRVWHNLDISGTGTQCKGLEEIAAAVRRCATIVVIMNAEEPVKHLDEKTLRTVSLELFKLQFGVTLILLGKDNLWSRLCLPKIFDAGRYIDLRETDWLHRTIEICGKSVSKSKKKAREMKP